MKKLLKLLYRTDKRWRLPVQLHRNYNVLDAEFDERLVLRAERARDPIGARRLIEKLGFDEATRPLPPRKPDVLARLRAVLCRIDGSAYADPYSKQYRKYKNDIKRPDRRIPIKVVYRDNE